MANRFGTDYDIDKYYFYLQEENVTMRRSHIHDQIRQEARDKKVLATQKSVAIAEREKQREFITSGRGHVNIETFLSPKVTNCSKRSSFVPVTNDTNNTKRHCNFRHENPIQDNPTYKQSEEDLCMQEVTEMIRTDHENIQEDKEELSRQERAAGYLAVDMKEEDKKRNEVELIAVSYPKEKLDQIIVNSIDGVTCKACGNDKEECHNKFFGKILKHEILTKIQYVEPAEVNDEWIKTEFTDKYRIFLRFHCYHMYGKYDEKQDYDLPKCIVNGSLSLTKDLVKHESVVYHLKQKREHGVGELFFGRGVGRKGFNCDEIKQE